MPDSHPITPSLPVRLLRLEERLNAEIADFEAREAMTISGLHLYRQADAPRISVVIDERHSR